jgi:phosphatidylinositol alpha-mannosyltransferase
VDLLMKVGIVVPYSWSYRGGVIEHAEQQARALRRLGIETRIIAGHDPPDALTRLLHVRPGRPERPPAHLIPIGRSAIVPTNGSLANVIINPAAFFRLRRALAEEAFDLLHLHEPAMPVPCMAALAVAELPLVGTFHASGKVPLLALAKSVYGFLLERLDARIAVSDEARDTAQRFFPGSYEIVPNGTPLPPHARPGSRANTVVFVGRHDRRKGLPVLLRAWPAVRAVTGARLRLIGADPLAVGLLQTRLGSSPEGVDLLGSISDAALSKELLTAKALIAPSLGNESFGMVLTRAFGCATPVIASDIPGYRALVTPAVGKLVPVGDPGSLAEAVISLLANEPARAACGAHARELADRCYSWPPIAFRLAAVYERLLSTPRKQEPLAA